MRCRRHGAGARHASLRGTSRGAGIQRLFPAGRVRAQDFSGPGLLGGLGRGLIHLSDFQGRAKPDRSPQIGGRLCSGMIGLIQGLDIADASALP